MRADFLYDFAQRFGAQALGQRLVGGGFGGRHVMSKSGCEAKRYYNGQRTTDNSFRQHSMAAAAMLQHSSSCTSFAMLLAANIVVAIIALLHVYILVLEMFLWDKPAGLRAFGMRKELATAR